MSSYTAVHDTLAHLISFDTTSRLSNLELIDWVEAQLIELGAVCTRIPNEEGNKANLWVRIGPDTPGGIVLSGHTDVVPVDGQDWHTDPFNMTEKDGLLFGRGTCDMKGFVALCLAYAPEFAKLTLSKPVHFAFSYDEEVGCQGALSMIDRIVTAGAQPDAVWVGEPSLWEVVSGHKGILYTEVYVRGKEAHSSQPHLGVSANGEAIELLSILRQIEKDMPSLAPEASPFFPPYPTLSVGEMNGGTAHNILARQCRFVFDLRCPPGFDPHEIIRPFMEAAEAANERLQAYDPDCGVEVIQHSDVPPLAVDPDNSAEVLLRALTGDNAVRAVSYATEAGQFHAAGLPTVICGPGSIDQAHKPNEFVAKSQLEEGVVIFNKLLERLRTSG